MAETGTAPVVELQEVTRRFGERPALDGVSMRLARGEIAGLIGRSGAGKSTLIRCLNGLDKPQSGRVIIDGIDITPMSEAQLQPIRRRVGMVFQHFNLLANKTVAENVGLPLKIAGQEKLSRRKRVLELLDLVGLADKADMYPAQLSGGQKQRVGIARALAPDPILLLSDEATSALDPETTQAILDLLQDVNRQLGLSVLMITHEMEVVRQIAHRVLVLDRGRIAEEGPVARVMAAPQAEITRTMLAGLMPVLPADIAARIAPSGDQALIRLDIHGMGARKPLISMIEKVVGVAPRLIQGGLNDVQGEPYGNFFFALGTNDPARIQAVFDQLGPLSTKIEMLGYVPSDV